MKGNKDDGKRKGGLQVSVLRIGYRPVRDDRMTTHAALVSRAFGAECIYMTEVDPSIKDTIDSVCTRWGRQEFRVKIVKSWKDLARRWKTENPSGKVVHLTMYGININEAIDQLKNESTILVVIGAEKVPREAFDIADFNIAIGNQPHSEVAALAVFLDRIFGGEELAKNFSDARLRIIPTPIGKKVSEVTPDNSG